MPSLYVINATSIAKPHAMQHLVADVLHYDVQVCIVTETWLRKDHDDVIFQIPGYTTHRLDRTGRRGGGIMILCKASLGAVVERLPKAIDNAEILWIKFYFGCRQCFIGGLYHPPNPRYCTADFVTLLGTHIDTILTSSNATPYPLIVLGGDFNQLANQDIVHLGLIPLSFQPTHLGNSLDRIYVNDSVNMQIKIVDSVINTKHKAIVVTHADSPKVVNLGKTKRTVSYRKHSPSLKASYLSFLQTYSWDTIKEYETAQSATDFFYEVALSLLDLFFPATNIIITSKDPEYITPGVKCMLRKKNTLMRKGRLEEANALSERIRLAIMKFNAANFESVSHDNPKELWERVRSLNGSSDRKRCRVDTETQITADELNQHYAAQSWDLKYNNPEPKASCSNRPDYVHDCFNEMAVFNYLDRLKKTAPGPDDLPHWFLQLSAPSFCKPLSHIFNLSLSESVVPDQFKKAIISPIPKIKKPALCADYRPISLTPIVARMLEKYVVRTFLYPAILESLPTYSDQFGFIPSGSTDSALIAILHHVTQLLTVNRYVRVIGLDFSKAFDTVRHSTIANNLCNLRLPDNIYNWFINYVVGHKHCTKFGGEISDYTAINSGVFQGSCVGPSLYVTVSRSLRPVCQHNHIDKYADDSYLIVGSNNESTIASEMQNIELFASESNLKLNNNKSKEILFYSNKRDANFMKSVQQTNDVESCTVINILGVQIENNFSMDTHVSSVLDKIQPCFYLLKILKNHGASQACLSQIFQALIVSKLTYASSAWWGFATVTNKARLQSVLKKGIKWGFYPSEAPSFEEICRKKDRRLFREILTNSHHVLRQFLPPVSTNPYDLRPDSNHGRILPIKQNATQEKNFFYRMLYSK